MFPFQLWKTVLVKLWQICLYIWQWKYTALSSHFSNFTMDTDQIERASFTVSKYSRHWNIGCISLILAMYTLSQSLVVKIIFRYAKQQKCWNKSYCLRNLGILFFSIRKEKKIHWGGKNKIFLLSDHFISQCLFLLVFRKDIILLKGTTE